MKQDGIAYEITGSGACLLMINGIGAPKESWAPQLDDLSSEFRCITFDNPGIGDSDALPADFTTADMAKAAAGLLTGLGVERAHVLGVSMGGAIAQELALNHPAMVERAALVCSCAACDRYLERCFTIMRDMAETEGDKGDGWSVAVQQFLSLIGFAHGDFLERFATIDAIERMVADAVAAGKEESAAVFAAQANACLRHDTAQRLGAIGSPLLILAGEADAFTRLHLSRHLAEDIADAELGIMEGCGHVMFYQRPAEFNRRVAAFLGGGRD